MKEIDVKRFHRDTYNVTVVVAGMKKGSHKQITVVATHSNTWGVLSEGLWQVQNEGFEPLGIVSAIRISDGSVLFDIAEDLWDEFK